MSSALIFAIRSRLLPAGIVKNGSTSSTIDPPTIQPPRGSEPPNTASRNSTSRIDPITQVGIEVSEPSTSRVTCFPSRFCHRSRLNEVSSPLIFASAGRAANVRSPIEKSTM